MPKFLNPHKGRVDIELNGMVIRIMPNQIAELPLNLGQRLQLTLVEDKVEEIVPEKITPEQVEAIDKELQTIKETIDEKAPFIPVFETSEEELEKHEEKAVPATPEHERVVVMDTDEDLKEVEESLEEEETDNGEEISSEPKRPKKRKAGRPKKG